MATSDITDSQSSASYRYPLILTLLLSVVGSTLASPQAAAQSALDDLVLEPMSIVVLVDESGSLSQDEVDAEARAAALLASIEVSDDSLVSVLGFGSAGTGNTLAVNDLCLGMQRLESEGARQRIETCAAEARRRNNAEEGFDTDHYSALRKALDLLANSPAGSQRVIFLLTDGDLDPGANSNFGDGDPALARELALERIRNEIGPDARELGVQIWPLGFGSEINESALEEYASLGVGANPGCAEFGRAPRARSVPTAADVLEALLESSANARCQALSKGSTGEQATVTVSRFATDGAIGVARPTEGVEITFTAPDGTEITTGTPSQDKRYQLVDSRQGAVVRFTDSPGGEWTVQASTPITPIALWEARVQALVAAPAQAVPGQTVNLDILVRSRTGFLRGFTSDEVDNFDLEIVELEGPALRPSTFEIDADRGTISSSFVMPSCPSIVLVQARFQIEGFVDRSEPLAIPCDETFGLLIEANAPCTGISPGETVPVEVTYSNSSGATKKITIAVEDAEPSGWVVQGNNPFETPAGANGTERFDIEHTGPSTEGDFVGRIVARDATDGTVEVASATLCGTFDAEPRNPWPIVGIAAAVLAVGWLVARSSNARSIAEADGLVIQLLSDGRVLSELRADGGRSLGFSIIDRERGPMLRLDEEDDGQFSVSRQIGGSLWPRRRGLVLTEDGEDELHPSSITLPTKFRSGGRKVEIEIRDEYSTDDDDDDWDEDDWDDSSSEEEKD